MTSTNSSPSILIIAPQINSNTNRSSPFIERFVSHLLKRQNQNVADGNRDGKGGGKVIALISPLADDSDDGTADSDSDGVTSIGSDVDDDDQKRLKIFFGSAGSKKLVRRIVEENQVKTVFLFVDQSRADQKDDEEAEDKEKQNQGKQRQIVPRTRAHLIPLCSLLEALRQCQTPSNPPPTLVPIFFTSNPADFLTSSSTKGQTASVQCRTEASARFSSAFALFHAFAVSYRLNVQIGLLQGSSQMRPSEQTMDFLMELAQRKEGKAAISQTRVEEVQAIKIEKNSGKSVAIPVPARVLLFGCRNAIQKAMIVVVDEPEAEAELLKQLKERAELFEEAASKPGLDTDQSVEQELMEKRASHVVFVHGADEQTMAGWEAGGPGQLRDNVRNNLFSPWLLAQLCSELGLHFMEFYPEHQPAAMKPIASAKEADSRYRVVRNFAELLNKTAAMKYGAGKN